MKKLLFILFLFGSILCKAQYTPPIIIDTVDVSSSELANSYTTAKVIIPAQGANKYVVLIKSVIITEFTTSSFTIANNGTCFMYTTVITGPRATDSFNVVNVNADRLISPINKSLGVPYVDILDQPLCLRSTAIVTGSGDVTAKIIVVYQIFEK